MMNASEEILSTIFLRFYKVQDIIIFIYNIVMFRRKLLTQLRSTGPAHSTFRSYSMSESTYRQKPSRRGSYAKRASMVLSTSKNAGIPRTEVMTVETPHLAGIGLAGSAASYSICALWSNVDETRKAKIIELLESEELNYLIH